MGQAEHWESVYRAKPDDKLSWFQSAPTLSLSLVDAINPAPRGVIDIGGGQSALAGALVERVAGEVTVLDISPEALARARARLGDAAARVRWIAADVTTATDVGRYDLWHDRAVFHFLTSADDRRSYTSLAARSVAPGGTAIIATFGPSGPTKCSGLEICRYDAASLAREFAADFVMVDHRTEAHATPWGAMQEFVYVVLKRA